MGLRNSIDITRRILRPAHFTTQVNMEIGNDSIVGLGTTTTSNQDARFANVIGTNVKVEGDVAMLDYDEVSWYNQQFATRLTILDSIKDKEQYAKDLIIKMNLDYMKKEVTKNKKLYKETQDIKYLEGVESMVKNINKLKLKVRNGKSYSASI